MTANPFFARCREAEESTLHAIRDCMVNKEVWERILPPDFMSEFFSLDLRDWMLWILRMGSERNMPQRWPEKIFMV